MKKLSCLFIGVFSSILLASPIFPFANTDESYTVKAEMREHWANEETSIPISKGTITLDTEGNLWYRREENLIPQKIDFGCNIISIENVSHTKKEHRVWSGSYMGSSFSNEGDILNYNVYVITEDGSIHYLETIKQTSDVKTPYVTTWNTLNTPKGSSSYNFTLVDQAAKNFSEMIRTRSVFFLTENGEIKYLTLGKTQAQTMTPGAIYWPIFVSGLESSLGSVNSPSGVIFTKLMIPERQHTATGFPDIYAQDSNGAYYKGILPEASTTSNGYIWETSDICDIWVKESHFCGEEEVSNSLNPTESWIYDFFSLSTTGVLSCNKKTGTPFRTFPKEYTITSYDNYSFTNREEVKDYSFLVEKSGYYYLFDDKDNFIKLFNNADIMTLFSYDDEERDGGSSGGGAGYSHTIEATTIYLSDSAGKVWKIIREKNSVSSSDGYTANNSVTVSFDSFILFDAGSPVTKICKFVTTNYELNNTNSFSDNSWLFLCKNGDIWAYGSNSHVTHWARNGEYYTAYGYSCIIGEGDFSTPKKVNNGIEFIDIAHYGTHSLALSKDGVIYRTGYYTDKNGDISPARYEGFTPTLEETMDKSILSSPFFVGYHFEEEIYDNMFDANNLSKTTRPESIQIIHPKQKESSSSLKMQMVALLEIPKNKKRKDIIHIWKTC